MGIFFLAAKELKEHKGASGHFKTSHSDGLYSYQIPCCKQGFGSSLFVPGSVRGTACQRA